MALDPNASPGAGTWADPRFVERWIARDAASETLRTPRAISTALAADSGLDVRRVIDLGAGPGTYLRILLDAFPRAEGTWVDASEAMLARARRELRDVEDRVRFVLADLRDVATLPLEADVVVTSRVVHHFRPETIRSFYAAAAVGLSRGGFLFNLDHFVTPDDWRERYERIRSVFVGDRRAQPHDHDAPPQPLSDHLRWLADAGFAAADVPWRLFWTALVVARTPSA